MEVTLKYGSGYKTITFPESADVTVMQAGEVPEVADPVKALMDGFDSPINATSLESRPAPASVAIAVPDETRPVPLKVLLPPLLERIRKAYPDLAPKNISVVVGGGLHPAPDEEQLSRILPEDMQGCTVVPHDALSSPMTSFGTTSRGTPVEVNAAFGEAELKIVIGQIDPHQFAGFTGGSKGVTIGCASKPMIENNHSLMSDPEARVGNILSNPVRQDLNESGEMIGIDIAVNVVMNPAKKPVALLVGNPVDCLMQGHKTTAAVYGLAIDKEYDIVIASCGGTPKDICLYQAQKGLNMASQCARKGGHIMLLAACPQGIGDDHYHDYVKKFPCAYSQLKEFKEKGFRMGAHKAFLFSRSITNFDVAVVSDLDADTLGSCHLTKTELECTIERWLEEEGEGAKIAVVPNANTMYFYRAEG